MFNKQSEELAHKMGKDDARDIKLMIAEIDRRLYDHVVESGNKPRPLSDKVVKVLKENGHDL